MEGWTSEAGWAPAGRPLTPTSAASCVPSGRPTSAHLSAASMDRWQEPPCDASHPPKPRSLLGLVPLRVFWPLNVLHAAYLQLGEEGDVVLGGRWPVRPPPRRGSHGGAPLPLSPEACLGSGSLAPPAAEGSGAGVSWRPRPVSPPPRHWDSRGLPSFRAQDTESQLRLWRPT